MGTKKGRIYDKVAPFKGAPQRFGGKLPQTAPPGSSTDQNRRQKVFNRGLERLWGGLERKNSTYL